MKSRPVRYLNGLVGIAIMMLMAIALIVGQASGTEDTARDESARSEYKRAQVAHGG